MNPTFLIIAIVVVASFVFLPAAFPSVNAFLTDFPTFGTALVTIVSAVTGGLISALITVVSMRSNDQRLDKELASAEKRQKVELAHASEQQRIARQDALISEKFEKINDGFESHARHFQSIREKILDLRADYNKSFPAEKLRGLYPELHLTAESNYIFGPHISSLMNPDLVRHWNEMNDHFQAMLDIFNLLRENLEKQTSLPLEERAEDLDASTGIENFENIQNKYGESAGKFLALLYSIRGLQMDKPQAEEQLK